MIGNHGISTVWKFCRKGRNHCQLFIYDGSISINVIVINIIIVIIIILKSNKVHVATRAVPLLITTRTCRWRNAISSLLPTHIRPPFRRVSLVWISRAQITPSPPLPNEYWNIACTIIVIDHRVHDKYSYAPFAHHDLTVGSHVCATATPRHTHSRTLVVRNENCAKAKQNFQNPLLPELGWTGRRLGLKFFSSRLAAKTNVQSICEQSLTGRVAEPGPER